MFCFAEYWQHQYCICVCVRVFASTVVRILPRHLRELTQPADIRAVHETLVGTPALLANVAFLEILKQWPLFGAVQFEVSVGSSTSIQISRADISTRNVQHHGCCLPGYGGHALVTEFRGMALNGLFCSDVLRPHDLVPLLTLPTKSWQCRISSLFNPQKQKYQ